MKHAATRSHAPAMRRDALLQQCALQRLMLAAELSNLTMPLDPGNLRARLQQHGRMPLLIAGATLGLLATRPKQVLRTASAGMAKWKSASAMLLLARMITDRFKGTGDKQ
ncbi:MAG: hypothetical protein V4754_18260 [Pseudomonadota bacterium]